MPTIANTVNPGYNASFAPVARQGRAVNVGSYANNRVSSYGFQEGRESLTYGNGYNTNAGYNNAGYNAGYNNAGAFNRNARVNVGSQRGIYRPHASSHNAGCI
jgi:hypothetical protein